MFEDLELIEPNVDIAPFLEVCASDNFGVMKLQWALSVDWNFKVIMALDSWKLLIWI